MKETHTDYSEIDLVDYIRIIYKRKWIILSVMFFGVLLTAVISIKQPAAYEASASFFPLDLSSGNRSEEFTNKPQIGTIDMIVAILKSRTMADKVIEQLDLKKLWGIRITSAAEKTLQGSIKVTIDKGSLIMLSAYANSAELSAKIANAYVDNLEYFNSQFNITTQRQIVQAVDRAAVPEQRMPRDTVKKMCQAGFFYFIISVVIVFSMEFIKKSNIINKIREK